MHILYQRNSGTADFTSSKTVEVRITKFKNPISTEIKSGFKISTKDDEDNPIDIRGDTSTLSMSAAMSVPATIAKPTF